MPKRVSKAKIACLDFSLQKSKMAMGVQVLIEDPDKLDGVRRRQVATQWSCDGHVMVM